MGRRLEEIDDTIRTFIDAQHMFFVATAPLAGDGHVNISPEGLQAFRTLSRRVAGLDHVGSGAETIAQPGENGLTSDQREKNARSIDGLPAVDWLEPTP